MAGLILENLMLGTCNSLHALMDEVGLHKSRLMDLDKA